MGRDRKSKVFYNLIEKLKKFEFKNIILKKKVILIENNILFFNHKKNDYSS